MSKEKVSLKQTALTLLVGGIICGVVGSFIWLVLTIYNAIVTMGF